MDTLSFRLLVLALCSAPSAGGLASSSVGLDRWECVFEVAYHQRRIDSTAAVELSASGQKHLAWGLSKRPQRAQVDLAASGLAFVRFMSSVWHLEFSQDRNDRGLSAMH